MTWSIREQIVKDLIHHEGKKPCVYKIVWALKLWVWVET